MARALLVIDVQEDYFPGGTLPLWQAEATEARIVTAIGHARAAGDRVILVRHISRSATGLFASPGTGNALRPAIRDAAGHAPVITKQMADAFQETDLAGRLEGCDDLMVCGMMTQNCVVFTAMSPAAATHRIQVAGDLCTAPSETVHRIALNALGSKLPVLTADALWQ